MFKIFIDPGHGGVDSGAVSRGLKEKDLTLSIAIKIKQLLEKEFTGHIVKLSRERDETIALKERTNMANKWGADYLISIHINAGKGTGFESFIYNGRYVNKPSTNSFRRTLHDAIVNETGFKDRGKKEANFHMVRESAMSAVLTENGFIDHDLDAEKLKTHSFLDKIARGHAAGLAKALGLKRKNVIGDKVYVVQQGDTLWGIAQKEHADVSNLLRLNPGIVARELKVGQRIKLR